MVKRSQRREKAQQLAELRHIAAKSHLEQRPYALSSLSNKTFNEKALLIMRPLNLNEELVPPPNNDRI